MKTFHNQLLKRVFICGENVLWASLRDYHNCVNYIYSTINYLKRVFICEENVFLHRFSNVKTVTLNNLFPNLMLLCICYVSPFCLKFTVDEAALGIIVSPRSLVGRAFSCNPRGWGFKSWAGHHSCHSDSVKCLYKTPWKQLVWYVKLTFILFPMGIF